MLNSGAREIHVSSSLIEKQVEKQTGRQRYSLPWPVKPCLPRHRITWTPHPVLPCRQHCRCTPWLCCYRNNMSLLDADIDAVRTSSYVTKCPYRPVMSCPVLCCPVLSCPVLCFVVFDIQTMPVVVLTFLFSVQLYMFTR